MNMNINTLCVPGKYMFCFRSRVYPKGGDFGSVSPPCLFVSACVFLLVTPSSLSSCIPHFFFSHPTSRPRMLDPNFIFWGRKFRGTSPHPRCRQKRGNSNRKSRNSNEEQQQMQPQPQPQAWRRPLRFSPVLNGQRADHHVHSTELH